MSLLLDVSPEAQADLTEIQDYVAAEGGLSAADRLTGRIAAALGRLRNVPELGARDEALGPGRRRIVVGSYLIVYEVRAQTVRVLRVVHGARDLPALFGG